MWQPYDLKHGFQTFFSSKPFQFSHLLNTVPTSLEFIVRTKKNHACMAPITVGTH